MTQLEEILPKIDLFLEMMNRLMQATERLADAAERIAPATAKAPNYKRSLKSFKDFDWSSIGAVVEERDRFGATVVNWKGSQYIRRNPSNKFGEAIWFSQCVGKNDVGDNLYEKLITFKVDQEVEPLNEKTARLL